MPIVSLLKPKRMRQDFWKFVDNPKLHEFEVRCVCVKFFNYYDNDIEYIHISKSAFCSRCVYIS